MEQLQISNPRGEDEVVDNDSKRTAKPKQSNRRGKGSKEKQHAKHIDKINERFNIENQRRIDAHRAELGYGVLELFGDRTFTPAVKPQREVLVDTEFLPELCDYTAEVLHSACKIPIAPDADPRQTIEQDSDTLRWVTALQVESKVFHARTGSGFLPDADTAERVKTTDLLLPHAIAPLAIAIDQIGRVEVEGQTIIPGFNGIQDMSYGALIDETNLARMHFPQFTHMPQDGYATPFFAPDGIQMRMRVINGEAAVAVGILDQAGALNPQFFMNIAQFGWFGVVEFFQSVPPAQPPQVGEIVARYVSLVGRVDKRIANAFVPLNLPAGRGTKSQLVCRSRIGNSSRYEAWSTRNVDTSVLEMGGILGLGYPCPMNERGAAVVESVVDTTAGLQSLANLLTKRIR